MRSSSFVAYISTTKGFSFFFSLFLRGLLNIRIFPGSIQTDRPWCLSLSLSLSLSHLHTEKLGFLMVTGDLYIYIIYIRCQTYEIFLSAKKKPVDLIHFISKLSQSVNE